MLAFTPEPDTRSQLALVWGVETYLVPTVTHTDQMAMQVDEFLLREGRVPGGRRRGHRRRLAPRHPRVHERPACPPVGDAKNRVAPAYLSPPAQRP